MSKLESLGLQVGLQVPKNQDEQFMPDRFPQVEITADGKKVKVNLRPVGPEYSEDPNGNIIDSLEQVTMNDEPVCFDLRLPLKDFTRYMNYYFAPLPQPKRSSS